MKIVTGVTYHSFEDKVYVHSVDSQKDYIFNGITFDILNFFSRHGDSTVEQLCHFLSKEYDVDESDLKDDMEGFVFQLLNENILQEGEIAHSEDDWSNQIPMKVSASFAQEHKLYSMSFELTYRCVEKCIHCYIDDFVPTNDAKKELTFEEYKYILNQAHNMGCVSILLTGGEVLLRPDFCDIAEYAVNLGMIVNIYTTGIGLTDKVFERLAAIKINSVSFSLYSGIATEHDAITGISGSFEKTLKAILMFRSVGINTFIKCVAMKQNFKNLESLYQLGKRLKLPVSVSTRILSGHEGKCAANYELGDIKLYKQIVKLRLKYTPDNSDMLPLDDKNRELLLESSACGAGLSALSVDPFGNVRACMPFPESFASIRDENLRDIWKKSLHLKYLKNKKMRTVTSQCESCKYIEFCQVCVADLFQKNHGDFDDCGENFVMAKAAFEARQEMFNM